VVIEVAQHEEKFACGHRNRNHLSHDQQAGRQQRMSKHLRTRWKIFLSEAL